MKTKMRVHNEMEVRALIKESFSQGDEDQFNGTVWYTHADVKICTSKVSLVEFELIFDDHSVTVGV